MASEDETISTADMAEDAAERARSLILAFQRHVEAHSITAVADAVADGARRGVTTAVSGRLATMSRADADMYAAAAASGAVASTLAAFANGAIEPPNVPCIKENGITMVAALTGGRVGAMTTSSGSISLSGHSILAFSAMIAAVSVFVILLRAF